MAKQDDEEWVEVAGVGQDEEAELIAGLLESEGIPCEVEGPSMTPFPEDIGAFGSSRVMVPPDRAEEARALIARRKQEFEASRGLEEEAGGESEE
jgi:Putative prokaryotic signal transducing protein